MRQILLACLIFFPLLFLTCSEDILSSFGTVDTLISEEEALSQNFNRPTLVYGMQVAIRDDVDGDINNILDLLDKRAAGFLECQFMMGPDIGFQTFLIPNVDEVTPLSMLRVFVVPFTFECEALDRDVCAGIFYPSSDLIIIAKESMNPCGILRAWKHEAGHRYGMAADHSNQNEFEPCIDPPDCGDDLLGLIDLID